MVRLRLHPRLRKRVDPSDVLQEAFLEASAKVERYLQAPAIPFFLWLRRMTADALYDVHRHNLGAQGRDARRERAQGGGSDLEVTTEAMAFHIVSDRSSPSAAARRKEMKEKVQAALDGLDPKHREILALRVFEQLTSTEAAEVLGTSRDAAKKRYLRALEHFKDLFGGPLTTDGG